MYFYGCLSFSAFFNGLICFSINTLFSLLLLLLRVTLPHCHNVGFLKLQLYHINTIIRKFSFASLSTKLMLFRAFCSPICGCQLWCSMFQNSVNKLHVAYNDAFRQLLREPRWCSASRLFAPNNVSSFAALMRKLMYSLLSSLYKCE